MAETEHFLDFENPIREIVERRRELEHHHEQGRTDLMEKNLDDEIERLHMEEKRITRAIYRNLDSWQKVQVARHQNRPQVDDYMRHLVKEFTPLAGDRSFAEDPALLAGLGRFNGLPVAILGTRKGRTTSERMKYSFGMPRPEGYRKAKRVMHMADKFQLPLLTFVDTPGAFPGVDAEARGQAEAIAGCIETLLTIKTPVISVITGEGGSGGALAIAVADKVIMLEHSVYSVISPEGCASILWKGKDAKETTPEAAAALKLTAQDLQKLKIIDEIIKEPVGAAHRDYDLIMERVAVSLLSALKQSEKIPADKRAAARREKFLALTRA